MSWPGMRAGRLAARVAGGTSLLRGEPRLVILPGCVSADEPRGSGTAGPVAAPAARGRGAVAGGTGPQVGAERPDGQRPGTREYPHAPSQDDPPARGNPGPAREGLRRADRRLSRQFTRRACDRLPGTRAAGGHRRFRRAAGTARAGPALHRPGGRTGRAQRARGPGPGPRAGAGGDLGDRRDGWRGQDGAGAPVGGSDGREVPGRAAVREPAWLWPGRADDGGRSPDGIPARPGRARAGYPGPDRAARGPVPGPAVRAAGADRPGQCLRGRAGAAAAACRPGLRDAGDQPRYASLAWWPGTVRSGWTWTCCRWRRRSACCAR